MIVFENKFSAIICQTQQSSIATATLRSPLGFCRRSSPVLGGKFVCFFCFPFCRLQFSVFRFPFSACLASAAVRVGSGRKICLFFLFSVLPLAVFRFPFSAFRFPLVWLLPPFESGSGRKICLFFLFSVLPLAVFRFPFSAFRFPLDWLLPPFESGREKRVLEVVRGS